MLLGEEFISANDADYNTGKDLLCRCPICGSEVFLSKGFEWESKHGKKVITRASWKHFKSTPESQVMECENKLKAMPAKKIEIYKGKPGNSD